MAWTQKSSNGPVTVAYLLDRKVTLSWQEAVAIVLEVGEVLDRSGKRSVPRHENLALTPAGTVEFRRGRTQSGDAVSALTRTLAELLPRDRPTQLRLLLSTAGPDTAAYKSVKDFIEALKYFERPGRRNIVSEIHQRALETPVPSAHGEADDGAPTPIKKPRAHRRRFLIPVTVVLAVALAVGGATLMEWREPGAIRDRAAPLEGMAAGAWSTAVDATAGFRESAARDLSTVLERVREAAGRATGDGTEADAESESSEAPTPDSTQSRASAPSPAPAANAVDVSSADRQIFGGGGEGAGDDVLAAVVAAPSADRVETAAPTALFDSSDVNVTPPVTLRLQLPPVAEEKAADQTAGVVEAIVSANGEVEKVKLVSPPESVHQAMILSAIKTWRFQPARKDGEAVRYRQLIPVTIPR